VVRCHKEPSPTAKTSLGRGGRRPKPVRKLVRARLGNADRLADSPSTLTEFYLALARPASVGCR
jgi:hypothetical protein